MYLSPDRRLLDAARRFVAPVFRVSWSVLWLSLLATVLIWRTLVSSIDATAQEAFDDLNLSFSGELQRSITAYEQVLVGAAALLQTRPTLSREEFRSYLQAVEVEERYEGLQGIGYAAIFSAPERAELEAEIRREGFKNFSVRPEGARPTYSAIIFLEPFDWRNQRAFGYDMYSEPVRRAAMMRARDSGLPAASGAVQLVQETTDDIQAGFLLYLPIYKTNPAPETEAGRRESIKGFVYSPFRIGNLIDGVISRDRQNIESKSHIEIAIAAPGSEPTIVYQTIPTSPKGLRPSQFVHVSSMNVHGTIWSVKLASTRPYEDRVDYSLAWAALFGGMMLSTLLSGLVASAALRQHETNLNNTRMELLSRELAHRVKNSLAVVQSIASRSLIDGRPVKEAREIFSQRLHALARAHTQLVENSWGGVSMMELAAAELQPFGARVSLRGPDVSMNANTAQMFALVVHELATNAVKHGALSSESGRVDLKWSIQDAEGTQTLYFRWKESGGPEVHEPSSKGFGQTLLKQAIVHGAIRGPETAYEQDGLLYEFEVPLATIQEETIADGQSAT